MKCDRIILRKDTISMPYFVDKQVVGDFEVQAKPIGRFRSSLLVRKCLPYFAGDSPRIKLIIKKAKEVDSEISFNAILHRIEPASDTATTWSILPNKQTPFEEEIKRGMLTNDGNYIFEISIDGVNQQVHGGTINIALLPVRTLEFIVWKWGGRLLFIAIGVILTLIVERL